MAADAPRSIVASWETAHKARMLLGRGKERGCVVHEHVRKTPENWFSYASTIRQGFSHRLLWRVLRGSVKARRPRVGNHWLPYSGRGVSMAAVYNRLSHSTRTRFIRAGESHIVCGCWRAARMVTCCAPSMVPWSPAI